MDEQKRESLSSRLGFLLLSAGCAIGLGNVWRFPYVVGKYGGAFFVLLYLFFLLILGLPIMVCEFSVGRASKKSVAGAFKQLEPKGTKWHIYSGFAVAGNYLLMMFYTVVSGWFLKYFFKMISGKFAGMNSEQITEAFSQTISNPISLVIWMVVVIILGFLVCLLGLQKGVERITKVMMSTLFLIMIGLAIYVATIPGSAEGYKFYLQPDLKNILSSGHSFWDVLYAAMGQAFFTISIGIGSMLIFGSYINKEYSLTGESARVIALDTFVALCSGLIIFPACAAFNVDAGSGPGLVFISLPNIFNAMGPISGRIVGTFFFMFLTFAAFSTVIAVFENIVAFGMDQFNWSRKKSVAINLGLIIVLSLPAALGMNVWSGVHFGKIPSIDALEDFIVSQNLLPLGSVIFLLFCTWKCGWGWDNFIKEANEGNGIKFPNNKIVKFYLRYIAPLIILVVFVCGYIDTFFNHL